MLKQKITPGLFLVVFENTKHECKNDLTLINSDFFLNEVFSQYEHL